MDTYGKHLKKHNVTSDQLQFLQSYNDDLKPINPQKKKKKKKPFNNLDWEGQPLGYSTENEAVRQSFRQLLATDINKADRMNAGGLADYTRSIHQAKMNYANKSMIPIGGKRSSVFLTIWEYPAKANLHNLVNQTSTSGATADNTRFWNNARQQNKQDIANNLTPAYSEADLNLVEDMLKKNNVIT